MAGLFLLTAGVDLDAVLARAEAQARLAVAADAVAGGWIFHQQQKGVDGGYKLQERIDGIRVYRRWPKRRGRQGWDRRQRDLNALAGSPRASTSPRAAALICSLGTPPIWGQQAQLHTQADSPLAESLLSRTLGVEPRLLHRPRAQAQFVVLGVNSIDNRWPSTDIDGPALTAIANNYSYRNRGDRGSLVLEEQQPTGHSQ